MILPATKPENIRLIRIPDDFEEHEAYRHVTGMIAKVEEEPGYDWDDFSPPLVQGIATAYDQNPARPDFSNQGLNTIKNRRIHPSNRTDPLHSAGGFWRGP